MSQTVRAGAARPGARHVPDHARKDLRLLEGYGTRSTASRSRARTTTRTRDTQGETAARRSTTRCENAAEALRGGAIVNEALLGTELHDVSKLIAGQQKIFGALSSRESQLQDLLTNFNVTMGALAGEQANLRETVRLLPPVLEAGQAGARQPQRGLPVHARLRARDGPGRPRDARDDRGRVPWVRQTRALLRPASCRAWWTTCGRPSPLRAVQRRPAGAASPSSTRQPCQCEVVLPTGKQKIADGNLSTGAAELQGVLPDDGRPRRARPELRRQRQLHALPARRRRDPVADRPVGTGRAASATPPRRRSARARRGRQAALHAATAACHTQARRRTSTRRRSEAAREARRSEAGCRCRGGPRT